MNQGPPVECSISRSSSLPASAELHRQIGRCAAREGLWRLYLTGAQAEQVAAARTGDFEQFTFKGWNNETVHAYVVKPIDFDPAFVGDGDQPGEEGAVL